MWFRNQLHEYAISASAYICSFLPNNRGITRAARILVRLFRPTGDVSVAVGEDGNKISFERADVYWGPMVSRHFKYEPEVENLLFLATRGDVGKVQFVDAGANIGLWSVRASSIFASTVAIEPNPETYQRLSDNTSLCGNVTALNLAIGERTGDLVDLNCEEHHASATVSLSKNDDNSFQSKDRSNVELKTISVDDLVTKYLSEDLHTVVKLDVEGWERQALLGADRSIQAGFVFLLEEHYKDRECESYCAVLELMQDPQVYFLQPKEIIRIHSKEQLLKLKTSRGVGYNIVAFESASVFGNKITSSAEIR